MTERRAMGSTNLAIVAALLIYAVSPSQAYGNMGRSCTTPQRQPGDCRSFGSCEPLRRLSSQRPLSPATVQLLRNSQCGWVRNTAYVCCPLSGNRGMSGNRLTVGETQSQSDNTGGGGGGGRGTGGDHPNLRLLNTDRCGSDFSEKITQGEEAGLKEYPWLALLQYQTNKGRQWLCGGALISDRYILTAAHCVRGIGNTRLVGVRLGEHNTETDPDCQATDNGQVCGNTLQDFGIGEVIAHPQYNQNSADKQNDIALIRLDRQARLADTLVPICLPAGETLTNKYEGKRLIVAGWGRTENGSNSKVKLWVQIPVMTNAQCAPIYSRQLKLSANQMCAGGVQGKDSCRGDSGGPLMSTESVVRSRPGAQWVAAGVVSIGPQQCGVEGRPGIYTRVGPYVSWILDNLKP